MERLRKAYASGKITKDKINKRGYSKFLNIDNDVKVSIDDRRIRKDEVWDGLKGYVTNTSLPPSEVVAQYREPWVVEKAFRKSKGTLETRPVFHFTEKRIEAHVCLCFVAYKVYKKLERIIADKRGQCHKDRQDNNDNKTQAAIKQRDDYAYHDADT